MSEESDHSPTRSHRVSLFTGIISVVATLISQQFAHTGFSPSQFLNIVDGEKLAAYVRQLDPGFRFVSGSDHYDGAYLWAMAVDPFAQGTAHSLIDMPGYRYGHPLWSWMARILSFGQIHWLDVVFWLMTLGAMFAAGYLVSRVAVAYGVSAWAGLLVAISPGLLFAANCSLTEPFQVVLISAVILVNRRHHLGAAGLCLLAVLSVMVCLTKEQLLLCIAALILVNLLTHSREMLLRVPVLLTGPAALGCWILVRNQLFSLAELTYDSGNIGLPFSGWQYVLRAAQIARGQDMFHNQIASTILPISAVLVVMIVLAVVKWAWNITSLSTFVMFQGILITCMGWRTLYYPHETWRLTAVFVVFFVLLLLAPPRKPFSLPTPATL